MTAVDSPPAGDIPFVSEQIKQAERKPSRSGRSRLLRPILWRLHFLGGLLAAPILLSLAVTGILFAWNPQIDALRFGDLMQRSGGPAVPLSQQVAAAQAARPDWPVHSVIPGHAVPGGPDITTQVIMNPPGGAESFGTPTDAVAVFVDERTGEARGEVAVPDLSGNVLRSLHSNWTLGDDVRPLTELAASWFLVSLLTGLYLWWPGLRRRGGAAFGFRRKLGGRRQSKDWHNFIGLALLLPMLFLVITGLTWTGGAGARYDDAKATLNPPPSGGVEATLEGAPAGRGRHRQHRPRLTDGEPGRPHDPGPLRRPGRSRLGLAGQERGRALPGRARPARRQRRQRPDRRPLQLRRRALAQQALDRRHPLPPGRSCSASERRWS